MELAFKSDFKFSIVNDEEAVKHWVFEKSLGCINLLKSNIIDSNPSQ
jgi:hypothetical protein